MIANESSKSSRAKGVLSVWFSNAKRWWAAALVAQIAVSLAAAITVVADVLSPGWGLTFLAISVVGSICQWRSDSLRQRAETLLRHVELEEGLGWEINLKVLSDYFAMAIPVEAGSKVRAREQGSFYASTRPRGPVRALENLQESAWWTQHLASFVGWIALLSTIGLGLVALWSLLVALSVLGSASPIMLSNVIAAVVALIFAGNLVRLPCDYFAFSHDAKEFDSLANTLAKSGAPTENDTLRLVADYQLRRAMGPPLPDWAWRLRRKHLNRIWKETRKDG